jgi:hypothetical protein
MNHTPLTGLNLISYMHGTKKTPLALRTRGMGYLRTGSDGELKPDFTAALGAIEAARANHPEEYERLLCTENY